jgi:hypothetical protein
MEALMGAEPKYTRWLFELFCTLRPKAEGLGLSLEELGNLETLSDRMQAEVVSAKTVASWVPLVGAWCRKP